MSALLTVNDLRVGFETRRGIVRAVDGVSFELGLGESVGIVGESGSGKTVTALSVTGLLPGNAVVSGNMIFEGRDLLRLPRHHLRRIRGKEIAMIFQDPLTALDPLYTIGAQIDEGIRAHTRLDRASRQQRALELLSTVRITSPRVRLRQYPHELSGGMRQRVVGAIAMSASPKLLIADEPTTALDVTTQVRYLMLLKDLQRQFGLALLLITHDLGILRRTVDRVAVMYAGQIVETGPTDEVLARPSHPYTVGLMRSLPEVDRVSRRFVAIQGEPPSSIAPTATCRFADRCERVQDICRVRPMTDSAVSPGRVVKCWFPY